MFEVNLVNAFKLRIKNSLKKIKRNLKRIENCFMGDKHFPCKRITGIKTL